MQLTRRSFLKGMLAACAAPAIVHASSLMPIYVPKQKSILVSSGAVSQDLCSSLVITRPSAFLHDNAQPGEVCFNTLDEKLYLYTGSRWQHIASDSNPMQAR